MAFDTIVTGGAGLGGKLISKVRMNERGVTKEMADVWVKNGKALLRTTEVSTCSLLEME
ncbi:hypothetical protein D3C74_225260 [compost metagenome]